MRTWIGGIVLALTAGLGGWAIGTWSSQAATVPVPAPPRVDPVTHQVELTRYPVADRSGRLVGYITKADNRRLTVPGNDPFAGVPDVTSVPVYSFTTGAVIGRFVIGRGFVAGAG